MEKMKPLALGAQFGTSRDGATSAAVMGMLSIVVVAALVVALVVLSGVGSGSTGTDAHSSTIEVLCAAGIRPVVERAAILFRDETGTNVRIQYGGSGALLAMIELSGRGDLYIAADDSFVRTAEDKGLILNTIALAHMVPVIAVSEGNPKNVRTIEDLLRTDISFAMANPSAAAIGSVTRNALIAQGKWAALEVACRVFKPTVNEVAADVKLGTVDAGIVWDATAAQMSGIESVYVEEFAGLTGMIEAGVLASSNNRETAEAFARFLAASDQGGLLFDELGYGTIERAEWQDFGGSDSQATGAPEPNGSGGG